MVDVGTLVVAVAIAELARVAVTRVGVADAVVDEFVVDAAAEVDGAVATLVALVDPLALPELLEHALSPRMTTASVTPTPSPPGRTRIS